MKLPELYMALTKMEAGKSQVNIAQMREIVKVISMILVTDPHTLIELWKLGMKHAYKKRK